MRRFIDIVSKQVLTEAEKKPTTTTATADRPKFDFLHDIGASNTDLATTSGKDRAPATTKLPGKKAGGAKTRRASATAGASMAHHPGMAQAMNDIFAAGGEDEISDEEARALADFDREWADDTTSIAGPTHNTPLAIGHEPRPTNDNLPALVNKEIALSGDIRVQPEWHQVKHLPRYLQQAIRAGGRAVFRQFTDTPLEDIQMICTLPGMNPERDVQAVLAWVRKEGVEEDQADMTFGGGIKADVRLWKTPDFSFLVVKDPGGIYIYAWTGGRGTRVSDKKDKRLGKPE